MRGGSGNVVTPGQFDQQLPLVSRRGLHRADELWDQAMAPLQLGVDVGPPTGDVVAGGDQTGVRHPPAAW